MYVLSSGLASFSCSQFVASKANDKVKFKVCWKFHVSLGYASSSKRIFTLLDVLYNRL